MIIPFVIVILLLLIYYFVIKCPNGSNWSGKRQKIGSMCRCKDNTYFNSGSSCIKCSNDQTTNKLGDTGMVKECKCPLPEQFYDAVSKKCINCPNDMSFNDNGSATLIGRCRCNISDHYFDLQALKCIQCPLGMSSPSKFCDTYLQLGCIN